MSIAGRGYKFKTAEFSINKRVSDSSVGFASEIFKATCKRSQAKLAS